MNIDHTSAPDRCPRCLRSKKEAIADHVKSGELCDCPDCPFREDISVALLESKKPTFRFGETHRPTFTFSEHKEPTLKDTLKGIVLSFGKTRLGKAITDTFS